MPLTEIETSDLGRLAYFGTRSRAYWSREAREESQYSEALRTGNPIYIGPPITDFLDTLDHSDTLARVRSNLRALAQRVPCHRARWLAVRRLSFEVFYPRLLSSILGQYCGPVAVTPQAYFLVPSSDELYQQVPGFICPNFGLAFPGLLPGCSACASWDAWCRAERENRRRLRESLLWDWANITLYE